MTTKTVEQRTLAAEVRAVTEGHQARLDGDGRHFLVKSDTGDATYRVGIAVVGETLVFTCDHVMRFGHDQPARTLVPCKHGAVGARRLERRGLLRWDGGRWYPTEKAYRLGLVARPVDDPFEGLPS